MSNYYIFQDLTTGEYLFRGKWYEDYPYEAIREYEEYLEEKADYEYHSRRDEKCF